MHRVSGCWKLLDYLLAELKFLPHIHKPRRLSLKSSNNGDCACFLAVLHRCAFRRKKGDNLTTFEQCPQEYLCSSRSSDPKSSARNLRPRSSRPNSDPISSGNVSCHCSLDNRHSLLICLTDACLFSLFSTVSILFWTFDRVWLFWFYLDHSFPSCLPACRTWQHFWGKFDSSTWFLWQILNQTQSFLLLFKVQVNSTPLFGRLVVSSWLFTDYFKLFQSR